MMRRARACLRLVILASLLHFARDAGAGTVIGSRHDLSTAGTPEVCEFCHTPHHSNTNQPSFPLWNRAETTQTFALYGSPTMDSLPMQPRTLSRLCMSCHDGVSASTMVNGFSVNTKHDLVVAPGGVRPDTTSQPNCERCHTDIYSGGRRTLVLGTNLSNDHPVSMAYPTAAQDAMFNTPPDVMNGWGGRLQADVKLFGGYVECGSCHNVHDPGTGAFLRKSNAGSQLCLTCHKK